MSVFTVVLSIELVEGLLNILLNSSSVLPLNSSDSVGSGIVVEPLPRVVLDSRLELGVTVETIGVTLTSLGIEVLLAVVPTACSIVLVGMLVLVDGTTETSSTVDVIMGALVVLGRTVVLVLKVVIILLVGLIVVEVVLEVLFSESALASKF